MIISNQLTEEELSLLHDNSFPIPNINNPLYFSKKLIIDNGELIAAGLVKLTCEGVLVINEKAPLRSRVNGIKALIEEQSKDAKKIGLDDCHVFIKRHKMQQL